MTTATEVFKRKGVYHSELVPATDPTGLVVTFTGRPMESKDKEGNWFVYFKHEGDEHYYNIENEDIRRTIEAAPVDQPVTVHALGSRDSATMMIEDVNGPYLPEGDVGATDANGNPGRPVDSHPNAPTEQAPRDEPERSQHEQMYWRAVLAAKNIHERFHSEFERTLTDDERNTATTIFIALSR